MIELDTQLISLAKTRNPDVFEGELNQLIQDFLFQNMDTTCWITQNSGSQLQRPVMISLIGTYPKRNF